MASKTPAVVLDVEDESLEAAGDGGCIFCAVVGGEVPADIVLADEAAVAFLDRRPLAPGRVLLVPRDHVATLPDLPAASVGPFFRLAQRLSAAVPVAMGGEGTFGPAVLTATARSGSRRRPRFGRR